MQPDARTLQLLHRYADGELSADEAPEVEALIAAQPELSAIVQQVRHMKTAVHRVMGESAAPERLAAQVRETLSGDEPAQSTVAGRIGPDSQDTDEDGRVNWVAGPRRINMLAMVATITIVTAAVLFGIFGPRIDDLNRRVSQPDLTSQAVLHVEDQHRLCGQHPEYRERKARYKSAESITSQFGADLGEDDLLIPDLTPFGYELIGGGRCPVPGCEKSAHVMYVRRAEGTGPAMLSLFIAANHGQYDDATTSMEPGALYASDAEGRCKGTVHISTDGTVVYFIAGCDQSDSEGIARYIAELLAKKVR